MKDHFLENKINCVHLLHQDIRDFLSFSTASNAGLNKDESKRQGHDSSLLTWPQDR